MSEPTVLVIGGGLAGMTMARQLALRHCKVTILERTGRLGGKAGSDFKNGRLWEHGYHVFPAWYPNIRTILARIGVRLIDFDRYHFLLRGAYPHKVTVRGPSSLSALWHNTFHGLLPWHHTVLYNYSVLDIISRPLSEKSFLDRVSQVGLLRGKWYASEAIAELGQENILKATAIPAYDLSAMTAKRFLGYWMRQSDPFLSVLPGDLQTVFIEPLVRELEALGVDIQYHREVKQVNVRDGAVASVTLQDNSTRAADVYALCTPFEVTRAWLDDNFHAADPDLGNMHFLEAYPMAAFHVRLRRPIPDLPREHTFFHASQYALSLIEVGRLWTGGAGPSELSFISSNFLPLREVSRQRAAELLLAEIAEYLPLTEQDIESWELNPNTDLPLFINTIGAWPSRPSPTTRLSNLYLAGDYVKNSVDLACMEGAVSSALSASATILSDWNIPGPHDLPET
ncbi:MAG: FAD-dependent oxidoreductase, partial [Bryobacteraceae bacterium]|nr:FAD-dependent oxidoreductase [Bryobacteraceae bacterium]